MTATTVEPGKIDIGRVIQQTFKVLGRNFTNFAILSALLVGLPSVLMAFFQNQWLASGQGAQFGAAMFFSWLVAMVTGALLQGALVYATVQDLNGQRPSAGDALATGLRGILPIVAVSILFSLALILGSLLLIVPGIMIACAWCVAIPALVADRTGIMGAFGRSAELTRGNRWRIFGLLVIWIIAAMLIGTVVNAASGVGAFPTDGEAAQTSPLWLLLNLVVSTIYGIIGATGIAVLYVELRQAREGLGPQWLSEVFS